MMRTDVMFTDAWVWLKPNYLQADIDHDRCNAAKMLLKRFLGGLLRLTYVITNIYITCNRERAAKNLSKTR